MLNLSLSLSLCDLGKNVDLIRYLFQCGQYTAITFGKAILVVFEAPLFGKRHDKSVAHLTQVVAWDSWKEVVGDLHMQTAVNEVEPRRTIDVHGGTDLAGRKALAEAKVITRLCKVGEHDLNVQR